MTDEEQRQFRAMVLLDMHESTRSVRLHSARLVQFAAVYETAARALRDLADRDAVDDISFDVAAIDAPVPDDVRRAVADVVVERTRRREAREQAARLGLLDD